MSEYGIEIGLYIKPSEFIRDEVAVVIEVIKITPKTITIITGLKEIDDWRLKEELGFDVCLIETNGSVEPKRYKIIQDDDGIGIRNNGYKEGLEYLDSYNKVNMEKVKFF